MITTYAVSFTTPGRTEADRIALVDVVTYGHPHHHPFPPDVEGRPGASLRLREADGDPVFRLAITETAPRGTHVETTTATVSLVGGDLTFDLRIVTSPRTTRIAPYKPPLPPPHVAHLVGSVLGAFPTWDADYQVIAGVRTASTELQGQEIAAFLQAPGRRLPVIIEIDDFERGTQPLLVVRPEPFAGLAHIWHVTSAEALRGFTEMSGQRMVSQGTIVVAWDPTADVDITRRREIAPQMETRTWARLIELITTTAARSIAQPRVPPPPRLEIEPDNGDKVRENQPDDGHGGREPDDRRDRDEQADDSQAEHVAQLEATIEEQQAALADADRIIADQRARLERKDSQLDELVLRTVSLETQAGVVPQSVAVASMREALRLAQKHCPFLVFHERALESGSELEGPDPGRVLADLVRLNEVARAWMSGEISGGSIKLACRQLGLDFAPDISTTARQKYVEDYIIEWRGRAVVAAAHLRRGRKNQLVRIHVYFDDETHQVVVAYIGRHLRDKTSAS
ncbi:MAG: hypothetical protein ACKOQ1_09875 [Actinomycetota bacterium]